MEKRQVSPRSFLSCAFLVAVAGSLSAQTWNTAFVQHDYNISSTGHGSFTSTQPTVTLPFTVARPDGTISGSVSLRYPAALPEGTIRRIDSGDYLVFSSPVTVGFHLEFDYAANATSMPHNDAAFLRLEISSGYTVGENSPCIVQRPLSTVPSGTTTHFSDDLSCTFSRVTSSGNRAGDPIVISNYIDFTSFVSEGGCSICTTLGNYIARYQLVSPLDLTVSRIEVVQATQDVNNSIRLVADKSTVARVFLGLGSETSVFQPPQVRATLHGRNAAGAELPGSPLQAENAPILAPNRPNREATHDSLNFKLPPAWTTEGTITLRAEVNPDGSVAETDRTNNAREQQAVFIHRNEFAARYLRICYLANTNCPSVFVPINADKMRKIFPIAGGSLSYEPLDVPTWIWPYNMASPAGWSYLTASLRLRYELATAVTGFDQLVGWLPDLLSLTGGVAGYSDPRWSGAVETGRAVWVMDLYPTSYPGTTESLLAHEVGHNLGLRHTNTADCGKCEDSDTDWPDPTSGRTHEVGFDTSDMEAIPASKFDVMTYRNNPGSQIWISPFHYNKLFDGQFRPMREAVRQSASETTYAIVSGSAKRDGTVGRLDPIVVLSSSAPAPASLADGNYCIRFSGAAGMLSDFCFELTFHTHPGHDDLDEEYFALRVLLPAGATRIALRRGNSELAARASSANPPTVTITSPAAGETWAGSRTLRWQGTDPDGDVLTYTVFYSADGGTSWLPIETLTTATEFTFDTAEIASGDRVHFRVLASDGFRTGEASVGPLTVEAAPIIGVQGTADFGSVKLGAFGETTLLITNTGKKALNVTAIRSNLGDFTVRDSFPLLVPPDGTRALVLRFTPAAEGVRSATVSFDSDDPARPVVSAQLVGAGVGAPAMQLAPSSLDFGSVAVGGSKELAVTIRNTGRGALTIAAVGSSNSQFIPVSPAAPFSIPEGSQRQVTVSFHPADAGSHGGTLSVAGNAGASALASTSLAGIGTGSSISCALAVSPANVSLGVEGGARTLTVTSRHAGCAWSVSANADWITVTSSPTGQASGPVSFTVGPNAGAPRMAVLTVGNAAAVVVQGGGVETAVVPAVASTPGALGSYFKTGVQLHNPTNAPISGEIVYHAAGSSPSEEDPILSYQVGPGATENFADLLPAMLQAGLGTVDVVPRTGGFPVAAARIFNDAGDAGTTGMTEELFRSGEALEAGQKGVLIAPPEPSRARFNLGVRSLAFGATIRFAVRDSSGTVRTTGAKFYPPSFFAQQTAEAFLGIALLANDTVTFEVDAGSAIVYGATTDNTTQDPSLQFARAIGSGSEPRRTIAAVAAAPGVLDSLFKTTLQLHNPTATAISGRLLFHPGGFSGSDSDPTIPYSLAPGATTSYADVLAAFGRTGLGSLDIVATGGPAPLAVARVFNDGGVRGTTGFSVDAARPEDALRSGETGVLIAPADPAGTRFNVGLRTLDAGATLSVTIRDKDGQTIRTFTKVYAPSYFEQQAGSVFLGAAPGPSESVAITVTAGSAIVYGASTDNKTQDPAIQVARAVRP